MNKNTGVRGAAQHPERNAQEAARAARGRVRRYCAANRLNRLATLTYRGEGCHDPAQLQADVALFFRALRKGLGRQPLPYLWVAEWHPGGHGLHVHFAVGRFVPRGLIESAWGRGYVSIKLLGDLPVGSGSLGEARLAARYLSKYVAKTFGDTSRVSGRHRYEVAQGFTPVREQIRGTSALEVLAKAADRIGAAPTVVWNSDQQEGWLGAPAVWAQWDR